MQIPTPDRLQREFNIPAEAGRGRAVPRVLLAYRGPNKKELLSTVVPMIVHHALPEHGQRSAHTREVSQHELAAAAGLSSRSSFTRRLSLFATPAPEWTDAQRQTWSQRQKAIAQARGRQIRQGNGRHKGLQAHLVNRQRGFAVPNRYTLPTAIAGMADVKRNGNDEREFRYSDLPAIVRNLPANCWDPEAGGTKGFKDVPEWIWRAELPVTDTARLVMTYYVLCGLLDDVGGGHVRGEVHPKQETVARALGISVKSVYNANQEWVRLGIIRVAHPKPTRSPNGSYVRGPAKIIYLPVRQLSREEADRERQRLLAAAKRVRDIADAQRALTLAGELLAACTGKEHALHVFWRDLRRKLHDCGIQRPTINTLVPPDLEKQA